MQSKTRLGVWAAGLQPGEVEVLDQQGTGDALHERKSGRAALRLFTWLGLQDSLFGCQGAMSGQHVRVLMSARGMVILCERVVLLRGLCLCDCA